jgi:hypothetical protein
LVDFFFSLLNVIVGMQRRRINRLKRAEAEVSVSLMEETIATLRQKQQEKNGFASTASFFRSPVRLC